MVNTIGLCVVITKHEPLCNNVIQIGHELNTLFGYRSMSNVLLLVHVAAIDASGV